MDDIESYVCQLTSINLSIDMCMFEPERALLYVSIIPLKKVLYKFEIAALEAHSVEAALNQWRLHRIGIDIISV